MITLVAVLCRTVAHIADPLCHEEIVFKGDQTMMSCQMTSQVVIADWKEKSVYHGDNWKIIKIGCIPGDYERKDAI